MALFFFPLQEVYGMMPRVSVNFHVAILTVWNVKVLPWL